LGRACIKKKEREKLQRQKISRWVGNIKMDLRGIGWAGMDWIDLAQGSDQWRALVNREINIWVP
jgi:hypothetical protein